jgi:hypothetical protein
MVLIFLTLLAGRGRPQTAGQVAMIGVLIALYIALIPSPKKPSKHDYHVAQMSGSPFNYSAPTTMNSPCAPRVPVNTRIERVRLAALRQESATPTTRCQ